MTYSQVCVVYISIIHAEYAVRILNAQYSQYLYNLVCISGLSHAGVRTCQGFTITMSYLHAERLRQEHYDVETR